MEPIHFEMGLTLVKSGLSSEVGRGSFFACVLLNWRTIPFVILWSLWNERDNKISRGISSSTKYMISMVSLMNAKQALVRKEFTNFHLNGILLNWEAYTGCGMDKTRKVVSWSCPLPEILKFNVDAAARGKSGPAGIGVVLRNDEGICACMFSKSTGVRVTNEAEVSAILKATQISAIYFHGCLIESNASNAFSWVFDRE